MIIQYVVQELYHEMHALDRFEQDCRRKAQEEDNSNAAHRGIYVLQIVYLQSSFYILRSSSVEMLYTCMPSKILYVMMLNNVLCYKVLLSKQNLWSVY